MLTTWFDFIKAFSKNKLVWNYSPCLIFCMIFEGKYLSRYILLTDQIPLKLLRFYHEIKIFFIIFKGLSATRNCFKSKSESGQNDKHLHEHLKNETDNIAYQSVTETANNEKCILHSLQQTKYKV